MAFLCGVSQTYATVRFPCFPMAVGCGNRLQRPRTADDSQESCIWTSRAVEMQHYVEASTRSLSG